MPPKPQLPQPLPPLPPQPDMQAQFDLRSLGFLYEAFDTNALPPDQNYLSLGFDNIWMPQDQV